MRANIGRLVTKLLQSLRRVTLRHAEDGEEEVPGAYLGVLEIARMDLGFLDDSLGHRGSLHHLLWQRSADSVTELCYREP